MKEGEMGRGGEREMGRWRVAEMENHTLKSATSPIPNLYDNK
jgi:hypothetical protein